MLDFIATSNLEESNFSFILNNIFSSVLKKSYGNYFSLRNALDKKDFKTVGQVIGEENNFDFVKSCLEDVNSRFFNSPFELEHSLNLMALTYVYCIHHNFDSRNLLKWSLGALYHDIGKSTIDPGLLEKSGRYTSEEHDFVKSEHIKKGMKIISGFKDFEINLENAVRNAIIDHHEQLDGSGYPSGKRSENISNIGKFLAIADVYQALTGRRTYKQINSPDFALSFLNSGVEMGKYDRNFFRGFVSVLSEEGILN